MVSQIYYDLSDLLYRWRAGEISIEILRVVSNHDMLRSYVEQHGVSFIYVPVPKFSTVKHFQAIEKQITATKPHSTVIAKHMYIIRRSLHELFSGCILNIHHSLPLLFTGAQH